MAKPLTKGVNEVLHHAYSIIVNPSHYNLIDSLECNCNIFVKSEMSANRVMKSVTSWLERKLFLKVSATKTKVVRPPESKFLGFTYLQRNGEWKCKPSNQSKMKLYDKCRKELVRRIGIARSIAVTFRRINQIVVGWINYYRIGVMKYFIDYMAIGLSV